MSPKTIDASAQGDWMHGLPGYKDEAELHDRITFTDGREDPGMTIEITLETSNAAFAKSELDEVCRILTKLALQIRGFIAPIGVGSETPLRDSNGNVVGYMTVKRDEIAPTVR